MNMQAFYTNKIPVEISGKLAKNRRRTLQMSGSLLASAKPQVPSLVGQPWEQRMQSDMTRAVRCAR